jgi:hypothetical protein
MYFLTPDVQFLTSFTKFMTSVSNCSNVYIIYVQIIDFVVNNLVFIFSSFFSIREECITM